MLDILLTIYTLGYDTYQVPVIHGHALGPGGLSGPGKRPPRTRFIYCELGLFKDFQLAELHDIFSPVVVHLKAEELVLAVDAAKLFTPSSIILMG